jgi:cytochrome c oxidase assembly protein Cox11
MSMKLDTNVAIPWEFRHPKSDFSSIGGETVTKYDATNSRNSDFTLSVLSSMDAPYRNEERTEYL